MRSQPSSARAKGCLRKVLTSRSVLVASLATVLFVTACSTSEPEPQAPDPKSPVESGPALIFLRQNELVRLDIESGDEQELGRVPAPDVFPVPGSHDRFLLVRDKGGGEDFAGDPALAFIDETGSRVASLGPGFSPLGSPDGRVAFLRSSDERVCEGEVCSGSVAVLIGDGQGRVDPLLPPGDWRLISWAGDSVIVTSGGRTFRAALGDELEEITVDPTEVWGASPDGDQLVLVRKEGVELLDLDSGAHRATDVKGPLAEGEWSPAGTELLAVEVGARGTELVRIGLDGSSEQVLDSDGAAAPLWGPDGSFAFARAKGLRLEAMYCEADGSCRSVLRWSEGIVLLALA